MMTNKEKYKQAFSTLHASADISLEENMNREKVFKPGRRLLTACLCVVMSTALIASAFAFGGDAFRHVFGWGDNFEITQIMDDNGEISNLCVLHTDSLQDPVELSSGRMFFIVNNEHIDISSLISQETAFRYEYTDDSGNTHYWFVGLNSDNIQNYGYAEYIKYPDGTWAGGYSARVNTNADGSADALWLEEAKSELNITR